MDDEESFGHQRKGEYGEAAFSADLQAGFIRNSVTVGPGWESFVNDLKADKMVERIIVMGVEKAPTTAKYEGESISFEYDASTKLLVLRKPEVSALSNWQIELA